MAETVNAQPVFIKDKNKDYILPASDWSAIQNKPNNLVTADQLPQDTGWIDANILNGTTGVIQYRVIGHTLHLYGQVQNYPVGSGDWNTTAFGKFKQFPNSVAVQEISDWLSVDGSARAQCGVDLRKGLIKVYRLEGTENILRFYKTYAID
jgi:hypothetical protein